MRAALLGLLAAGAQAAPYAYITNQGSHDVSVIDSGSEPARVVATVPVGRSPAGVAVAAAAGKVFVSNPDSKTVSVIGMREQRVVATLPAGAGPVGIATTPGGEHVFVADWYRNRLLIVDAQIGRAHV